MHYSSPSLHAPILKTPAHKDLLGAKLTSMAEQRLSAPLADVPATTETVDIPLTTVSLASNFDAYISIRYGGAPAGATVELLVDSGNFSLIVPDYGSIAALPNFKTDYVILADENVTEPWGCPAVILRGPIEIPTPDGVYKIPDCVFYACSGPNRDGKLTANFGVGRISPWIADAGVTIQSPLSYNAAYPYAEFNYAPAGLMFAAGSNPLVAGFSSLTLYKTMPAGYQMFDILKDLRWMSLTPQGLSIGGTRTGWPGTLAAPIAMVDTGGGPVFLSDPNGYVFRTNWPQPVPSPPWTSPGSVSCQSTKEELVIELGDRHNSFSYRVDTTKLPSSAQGLTLVMCEKCEYMMGENGMNIGGLSALFNYILIGYASAKVGFKVKPSEPLAGTFRAPAATS
jgi:hypothetical protein